MPHQRAETWIGMVLRYVCIFGIKSKSGTLVQLRFSPNNDEINLIQPNHIAPSIPITIELSYVYLGQYHSLLGREESRSIRDSNTLRSFLNPKQQQAWFGWTRLFWKNRGCPYKTLNQMLDPFQRREKMMEKTWLLGDGDGDDRNLLFGWRGWRPGNWRRPPRLAVQWSPFPCLRNRDATQICLGRKSDY